jgi:hypothetical protein
MSLNSDIEFELDDPCGTYGVSPYILLEDDDDHIDLSDDVVHPYLHKKDIMKC